ncbi:MAG: hypothetical protein QOF59_115 [Actinomycetota bacterium]|nr:hypothetical protein [Actinomycetota bacterium]
MSAGTETGTDTRADAWERAVAACERRLVVADSALRNGDPAAVEPFAVPPVEGEIPSALVDRARACADRGEALQAQLADELERIRRELRRLPRMPPTPPENRFDAQA